MYTSLPPVTEIDKHSVDVFKSELIHSFQPVLIKSYVEHWESVGIAQQSSKQFAEYLMKLDLKKTTTTYYAAAENRGRMFYKENLAGFNFDRISETLTDSLERIVKHLEDDNPPCVYTGAVEIDSHVPEFAENNHCELPGKTAKARIWVGNAASVSTHYDMLDNIVCAVAGQRTFTLFPPEQIKNLYVGPIDYTLSGQPVSMVDLHNPDLETYPKFSKALAQAQVAHLEPGDALYIPKLWWHQVESKDKLNAIVNYWWDRSALATDNAFTTLLHGLMTISHLPKAEREAWRAFFDHYIFHLEDDPAEHIPHDKRGALGEMTPMLYNKLKNIVLSLMTRK